MLSIRQHPYVCKDVTIRPKKTNKTKINSNFVSFEGALLTLKMKKESKIKKLKYQLVEIKFENENLKKSVASSSIRTNRRSSI